MIYLDYNATTPVDEEVVEAMLPYLKEHYGNPSSTHASGARTRDAVERARTEVAALLDCRESEIIFTSGGTEANNHALRGLAFARRELGNHIITSSIEHPAVLQVCRYLAKNGFEISYLPVDEYGLVNTGELEKLITPRTILISVMHANNETGTIEPISEISRIAAKHGIKVHTDAAQSAGKISVSVKALGVDMLSLAGHKLYAPKGVGALYVKEGVLLENLLFGAGHEGGRRAGTEAVHNIAALGRACEIALKQSEAVSAHMKEMRDRLHEGLQSHFKGTVLNGHSEKRLPNTLNISIPGIDAPSFVSRIGKHLAISAGAACHSGSTEISHVLKAMGKTTELGNSALRLTTGRMTTEDEVKGALEILKG